MLFLLKYIDVIVWKAFPYVVSTKQYCCFVVQLFQIVLFQGETLKKVEDTILKLFPFRYCWQTECLHTYPTHQTVTRLKAKIMVSHKETQNLDHLSVVKTEHVSSVTDKYLTLWLLSSLESSN